MAIIEKNSVKTGRTKKRSEVRDGRETGGNMKIAMIGHKRIPSREGGIEIVVEELSVRLAAAGHTVCAYNRMGGAARRGKGLKEYRGVRIITVPTVNVKSLDAVVYSFFATVRALFGRYDVIHYHAEGPCAMIRLAHLFGVRTVATIHGLDWRRAKWGAFASNYLLFGERTAAKYADEIIVLSRSMQKYFQDTYGRQTNYIPNGVNRPERREPRIIAEKYGLEKNGYLLFLARLVPEKGLHYLLEAFLRTDTDKKLVIAGGGSHSGDYVERIRAAAARDPRVVMTGFVQGEELEELFSNCLLYVLPSDVEGMPLSLLEAMSYGCRCLVSGIDENREVCGEFAEYFEKSDTVSLGEKLKEMLAEDGFDGAESSGFILGKYSWDDAAQRTAELYARRPGGRSEGK